MGVFFVKQTKVLIVEFNFLQTRQHLLHFNQCPTRTIQKMPHQCYGEGHCYTILTYKQHTKKFAHEYVRVITIRLH